MLGAGEIGRQLLQWLHVATVIFAVRIIITVSFSLFYRFLVNKSCVLIAMLSLTRISCETWFAAVKVGVASRSSAATDA